MKKDLKHLLMPSQKWKNSMPHQQLTATIIPPSTVDVMLNEEDCCFQCQEPGYITQHCPHYECDKYGHIIMECPHRIPPSRTPATHLKAHKGHHARSSLRQHHEDQSRWSQSRSQSHYWGHHNLSHHNLHRGHSRSQTGIDAALTEAAHDDLMQPTEDTATDLTMTHCTGNIADHQHTLQLFGLLNWDSIRSHSWPSYQSSRHESCRSDSYSSRMRRRPHPKKNMKVKIEDLHTDYYSLYDHSSDSGETQILQTNRAPLLVRTLMNMEGYLQSTRWQWHSS